MVKSTGHKAFELLPVIENFPKKVTALAVWGNTLYVGTAEGALLSYDISYNRMKEKRFEATLIREDTSQFAQKSVTQLCPIPELGLIVSLADTRIRIHTLSSLREVAVLKNEKGQPLKGCTSFALKKKNGEFNIVIAKKKSLYLLKYDEKYMHFVFKQELMLPDAALSLIWSGSKLCVGFKNMNYYLISTDGAGQPKPIFNNASTSQAAVISLSLPEEIILVRDNIGVPLSFEGKAIRTHGITFSDFPTHLAQLKPYLVAPVVGSYIEIRMLSNDTQSKDSHVQMFPLAGVTTISQPNFVDLDEMKIDEGNGVSFKTKQSETEKPDPDDALCPSYRIFLATKTGIFVLVMRQIFKQAQELQQKKEFDKALMLCDMFEGTKFEVEAWRTNSIHLEFGFELFTQKEFESAMEHFVNTDTDPRIVISLYPDLLKEGEQVAVHLDIAQRKKVEEVMEEVELKNKALVALIPLLNSRRVPIKKRRRKGEKDDKAAKQKPQPPQPKVVDTNNPFFVGTPGSLPREINVFGNDDAAAEEEEDDENDPEKKRKNEMSEAIGEAVDTALLKAMLLTNDDYLLQFIGLPNRCNIEETSKFLMKYKKFNELVIFYKMKELHYEALSLLEQLGNKFSTERAKLQISSNFFNSLDGVAPTIKYLQQITNNDQQTKQIIFKFSEWVLQQNPTQGIDIFCHDKSPLSPMEVIDYLAKFEAKEESNEQEEMEVDEKKQKVLRIKKRTVKIAYLEHLIYDKSSLDSELHNMLISSYLDYISLPNIEIMDQNDEIEDDSGANDEEDSAKSPQEKQKKKAQWTMSSVRERLKKFLVESTNYIPLKFMTRMKNLHEERAILLAKIKKHDSALDIYVNILKSPEKAEEYCVQYYAETQGTENNTFILLLRLYLDPRYLSGKEPNTKEAIRIMNNHYREIDVVEVIKMIPEDISVTEIANFFANILKENLSRLRSLQVMKNLTKSENLEVNADLIGEKKKFVKQKPGTICKVCGRKIGHSAFCYYPNGHVYHYGCCSNREIDPITKKNFADVTGTD